MFVEYVLYVHSFRIYEVTFAWVYMSGFFSELRSLIGFKEFLLYVCAALGVLPIVLASDQQFHDVTATIARPFLSDWVARILIR